MRRKAKAKRGRPKRNTVRYDLAVNDEEADILEAYQERYKLSSAREALRRAINVHMRRAVER